MRLGPQRTAACLEPSAPPSSPPNRPPSTGGVSHRLEDHRLPHVPGGLHLETPCPQRLFAERPGRGRGGGAAPGGGCEEGPAEERVRPGGGGGVVGWGYCEQNLTGGGGVSATLQAPTEAGDAAA